MDRVQIIAQAVSAAALIVIAAAAVGLAVVAARFVDATEQPWTAPWVNSISGGERVSWHELPTGSATETGARP